MDSSAEFPRSRWLVLLAAVIGYIASQVANLCPAPVLPQVAASLNINLGSTSNLVMTPFLLSGCIIMLLIGGVICDRYGVLVTLIVGGLLVAAPATLLPMIGHSTTAIFWSRIVQGGGQGFLYAAVSPIVALWFPNHQKGLALGCMSGSVAAGSALGLVAGPWVFARVANWQTMCAWLSVITWVGVVLAVVLVAMPKAKLPVQASAPGGASDGTLFKRALVSPVTLLGVLVSFMACWDMQCLYNLTSTFLAAGKPVGAGFGSMTAGSLMLGVTLLGGVGGPILCGQLLDRVFKGNAKTMFLMGFAMMCVFIYALTLPAVLAKIVVLEAVLILSGFGVQFVLPTLYYFVAKAYPPQLAGKMSGIWIGIGTFGGVVGMYIAGVTIRTQNSYRTSLLLEALVALVGFVLVFALAAANKPKPAQVAQGAGAGK